MGGRNEREVWWSSQCASSLLNHSSHGRNLPELSIISSFEFSHESRLFKIYIYNCKFYKRLPSSNKPSITYTLSGSVSTLSAPNIVCQSILLTTIIKENICACLEPEP